MTDSAMFGRYRLLKELGKGATCSVFMANDGQGQVALKILHRSLAADPVILSRFRQEAVLARSLKHPALVQVYDLVQDAGRDAIVMEYCPGGSLADYMPSDAYAAKRVRAEQAEQWLRQLAAVLDYAHGRGWVHRAIKPENILFAADGRIKLADFGAARLQNLSGLTTSTSYLASPLYIAPEVMTGDPCRPAHDLYSLGAVFYQLLSGTMHRDGSLSYLLSAGDDSYIPLNERNPALPVRLCTVVDTLLAPAGWRPGSASLISLLLDGSAESLTGSGKHCLYCDALMPEDSPFCPSCGEDDLYPAEYREKDAEAIVLTRLSESADTMNRLYRFLHAWSGEPKISYRFVTENARMYSKEELKQYLQLPYPIINWLQPDVAVRIIKFLEIKGFEPMHLERQDALKIERKASKKSPLLRTRRPERFKPIGSDILVVHYESSRAAGAVERNLAGSVLAGSAFENTVPDNSALPASDIQSNIVYDCQRLADLLSDYGREARAAAMSLAGYSHELARQLRTVAADLDAISLPALYAQECRLNMQLAEEDTMGSAMWQELQQQLQKNRQVWQQYDELETRYAQSVYQLEKLQTGLRLIVHDLSEALQRYDPVANSRAYAALQELRTAIHISKN